MTQEHPITPPPELVDQWKRSGPADAAVNNAYECHIAARAAQWGADQEMEACLNWLTNRERFPVGHEAIEDLKADRRPKPPSLKEQALLALSHLLDGAAHSMDTTEPADYIRRALEQLPDNK